jgi:hypothetical protein
MMNTFGNWALASIKNIVARETIKGDIIFIA